MKFQVQVYHLGAVCVQVKKTESLAQALDYIKAEQAKPINALLSYEIYDNATGQEIYSSI